jgi:hypothetical protein
MKLLIITAILFILGLADDEIQQDKFPPDTKVIILNGPEFDNITGMTNGTAS